MAVAGGSSCCHVFFTKKCRSEPQVADDQDAISLRASLADPSVRLGGIRDAVMVQHESFAKGPRVHSPGEVVWLPRLDT